MEGLKLRRSARKDSMRLEKLVYKYYFDLVPVADGFCEDEELICKKILDQDGNLIAGIVAFIYQWGCLYVDDLWIDEKYRRQAIGSTLLQTVEDIAIEKGCYLVYLDTGDFQAKPFYLKHGYTVFGTVKGNPVGHEDYVLFKRIDKALTNRPCPPIDHKILDGNEEDAAGTDEPEYVVFAGSVHFFGPPRLAVFLFFTEKPKEPSFFPRAK